VRRILRTVLILLLGSGCTQVRYHRGVSTFAPGNLALIQSTPAPIRADRSHTAPVVGSAAEGDRVVVQQAEPFWVRVRRNKTEGWVHESAFLDGATRAAQERAVRPTARLSTQEEFEQLVNELVHYLTNKPSCF